MGLSIGQTPSVLTRLGTAQPVNRFAAAPPTQREELGFGVAPRGLETDVRAGFGTNTISGIAAAFQTLDTNLERAREVVPDFDDLNAQARAASAELRAQFRDQFATEALVEQDITLGSPEASANPTPLGPTTERLIPEPSGQVRNFTEGAIAFDAATLEPAPAPEPVPVGPVLPQQNPLNVLA
jgi:hypothetical protein